MRLLPIIPNVLGGNTLYNHIDYDTYTSNVKEFILYNQCLISLVFPNISMNPAQYQYISLIVITVDISYFIIIIISAAMFISLLLLE